MAGAQFWSSRFGFLMASIGFAVGLGNIWRFPYVTGENGGSAFVAIYLLCVVAIGVPILMAEVLIGRRGGLTPPESMMALASASGRSRAWGWVGRLNLLTAFSILVSYGVVAGWVLYYFTLALQGELVVLSAESSVTTFNSLLADIPVLILWTLVALGIAVGVIYAGVQKGIERAVTILMPMLFALLVLLAVFNVFAGGMDQALAYLFTPDFSKVTPSVFLAAVGQAFFSIGVAMAGMMMFGAYLPRNISIAGSAFIIVAADTLVALLAGLVIFPMVFQHGLDPAGGTGLIFLTLPVAFAQMSGGLIVSILFFLLLSVAAITSVVGLCEPLGAWIGERFGYSRHKAAGVLLVALMTGSTIGVLSFNAWQNVEILGRSLSDFLDFLPNQVFLPVGGLLIALFAGWFLRREISDAELGLSPRTFALWHNLMRFVVVPAVAIILITGLFQ